MLHQLPKPVRQQCAREMHRVLKPGGRVLAVDFATPARERRGLVAHLHRRGGVALADIVELLSDAGLRVVESGSVGVSDLQFAFATSPSHHDDDRQHRQTHVIRSLDPLPAPRWLVTVLATALVAGHGVVLGLASSRLALSAVAVVAIAGLLVMTHSRFVGAIHALARRRSRR
jgi:SAM-dependent methyltransferase